MNIVKPFITAVATIAFFASLTTAQKTPDARQTIAIKSAIDGHTKPAMLSAAKLVQDGTMIHMAGAVEIRIYVRPTEVMVIRADEADYNAATAEVAARGSASSTFEPEPRAQSAPK